MKPIVEKQTLEHLGNTLVKQQGSFSIKQSREMFKLLSSGVYSDKVLAVIRELSANACDAHAIVGKHTVPFEVHLPNQFEPWFHVRDFGPGLAHDDVMLLYSCYGYSSKRDSNEATGFMGIGSKVGFAYTDQFTVTSRYNGYARVYSCFVSEEGNPEISLVSEKSLSDPQDCGLEVAIAVTNSDFREFATKAIEVFDYYKVRPTITGNVITFPSLTIVKEGVLSISKVAYRITDRVNRKRGNYYSSAPSSESQAIQGSCVYPIEKDKIVAPDGYLKDNLAVYSAGIILEFPIGSLNVTASRESLEYDKPTTANLLAVAKEMAEVLAADAQDAMDKETTHWGAIKQARHIIENYPNAHIFQGIVKWNGNGKTLSFLCRTGLKVSLLKDEQMTDPIKGTPLTHADGTPKMKARAFASIRTLSEHDIHHAKKPAFRETYNTGTVEMTPTSDGRDPVVIVDDEETKNFLSVIMWNYKNKILADTTGTLKIPPLVVFIKPYDATKWKQTYKETVKQCSGLKVYKMSELEEPQKTATIAGTAKVTAPLLKVRRGWTSWEELTDVDLNQGGYYVNTTRFYSDIPGYGDHSSLSNLLESLEKMQVLPAGFTLYGIPASFKDTPNKFPGWVHVKDHIIQLIEARLKNFNVAAAIATESEKDATSTYSEECQTFQNLSSVRPDFKVIWDKRCQLRNTKTPDEFKLKEMLEELTGKGSGVPGIPPASMRTDPDKTIFGQKVEEMLAKYPLCFKYSRSYMNDKERKMFKHYMDLVDANLASANPIKSP